MDSRELESACIIVGCSESHANNIKAFEANKGHIISYESEALEKRETTPLEDERRVYFGLRPRTKPVYFFGTVDERIEDGSVSPNDEKETIHFQLASKEAGLRLRMSEEQFCLEFNQHGSWMLVDRSSNGTWVNQDWVASNKARGHATARGTPTYGNFRRIALHPEDWSLITAGKLQFHLKVGKDTPLSFVPERDELDLDDLHVQSNPTSSSSLTPSTSLQPAFVDLLASRRFHFIEKDSDRLLSGMKILVDKSTGQRLIGQVYTSDVEKMLAKEHYKALFDILKGGREKNLIPFLGSTMDGSDYMIISEYWPPATGLSEYIEEEATPNPLELGFIFVQINHAISYLHSKGIIHRNIRPESISVTHGSPVTSRLTGFSEAVLTACATEVVGHQDFRAPEMNGIQEYDQLIDVFSLSKVIQYCLTIQQAPKTLMDSIVQKGLAVDTAKRYMASRIQKEIDSTADGEYEWPFRSVTLKRRFKVAWYHERNNTYIRLSDLYRLIQSLADPYYAEAIPPIVKTRNIHDLNFPGEYCRLVYGRKLFEACGLRYNHGVLKPRTKRDGVFSQYVDLDFDLYYHSASQMFNVTTLLQTVPLELARVATWDLQAQVQEVHGDAKWEGNYIDRRSFEQVLERVQKTETVKVLLDDIKVDEQRANTRFSMVDSSKEVIVVTRWVSPPWVTLNRVKGETSLDNLSFGSQDELREWCTTHSLQHVLDRINLTIGHQPILQDWKVPPKLALPPLGDNDMTLLILLQKGFRPEFFNVRRPGPGSRHAGNVGGLRGNMSNDKVSKGYIQQDATFLVATPINLVFFLLPLLPSTLTTKNRESDSGKVMPLVDAAVAQFCDSIEVGGRDERMVRVGGRDERMVRVSEDKVVQVLHASVTSAVAVGRLPASMEERFVARALEAPVLGLKPLFPDFTPLHDHLKHISALKAEAVASRSLGDFSRKRGRDGGDLDESEAAAASQERAEKKRKQEEDEKRKRAGQSRALRELNKVNVKGMKKMSDFFAKKPPPG
ncbi:hypothetical protein DV738_g1597, partial [Chaetothyriales sp. CBS 135597]